MTERRIELSLPAEQGMMIIVRMTTTGVLARAGMPLDDVDDVKMAVEEACNCLIMQGGLEKLHIAFTRRDESMAILVSAPESAGGAALDQSTRGVLKCILESMTDEVEFRESCGRIEEISLIKRLPLAGERHDG